MTNIMKGCTTRQAFVGTYLRCVNSHQKLVSETRLCWCLQVLQKWLHSPSNHAGGHRYDSNGETNSSLTSGDDDDDDDDLFEDDDSDGIADSERAEDEVTDCDLVRAR